MKSNPNFIASWKAMSSRRGFFTFYSIGTMKFEILNRKL